MTSGDTKQMSESQVVHYMLCCHSGICAPADLVLSTLVLKQPDSSWTDTVLTVSLCETPAQYVSLEEINSQACTVHATQLVTLNSLYVFDESLREKLQSTGAGQHKDILSLLRYETKHGLGYQILLALLHCICIIKSF